VTGEEAAAAALAYLADDASTSGWDPAVTGIEDAGTAWRVFYNTRAFVDSGHVGDALAGNWPVLVTKDGGQPSIDREYRKRALEP
jgi:hypothetical protein